MKKIKLLITSAALLVGGGLLASSSNNIMKANAAEEAQPIVFDTTAYGNQSSYGEFTFGNKWMTTSFGGGNNYTLGANKSSQASSNTFDTYSSCFSNIGELSDYKYSVAIFNLTGNELQNIYKLEMSSTKLANSTSVDVLFATSNTYLGNYELEAKTTITSSNLSSFTIELNEPSENDYYSIIFATSSSYFRLDSFKANIYTKVIKYNVNFYDGDSLISTETVNDGETVDFSLVNAEKDGYVFDGWYEDPSFTIAYDENAPVTGDLNLYAHYIAHEDLTSGEIFASETTKTSLVASTNKKQSILKNTINYANFGENFVFNGESKLSSLGFDEKWTYESKDNGSNYYPTIYASDDTLRFYKNGTFVKFNYMGIIHSIAFSNTAGLDNFTISGDDGIEVKGDNGKYTFENGTSSIKILNNANDTIKLYGNFSIEYEDMITVPTNASIRFGATLDSKIYDETAKYGVVFGLAGEDLNTLAEGKTTIDELALPYQEVNHDTIAKVDEEGALEESDTPETAQYFQYAIVVNNMLAHIDEEITAACYMQTTDGLYVMDEVTYSLRSLAQKYIDEHVADESIDVLNAIVAYQA